MPTPVPCKKDDCGKLIQWVITPNGSRMPVDATSIKSSLEAQKFPVLYEIIPNVREGEINTRTYTRAQYTDAIDLEGRILFASHFATCTAPNSFSRRAGRKKAK